MSQKVSPAVVIGVIVIGVAVIGLMAAWIFKSPSVSVPQLSKEEAKKIRGESMMNHGPTPEEMKQIQEWKKQHPGSFSPY